MNNRFILSLLTLTFLAGATPKVSASNCPVASACEWIGRNHHFIAAAALGIGSAAGTLWLMHQNDKILLERSIEFLLKQCDATREYCKFRRCNLEAEALELQRYELIDTCELKPCYHVLADSLKNRARYLRTKRNYIASFMAADFPVKHAKEEVLKKIDETIELIVTLFNQVTQSPEYKAEASLNQ